MFLQSGGIDVHVVGYIVKHHIYVVRVRAREEFFQFLVCTEALIDSRGVDGPIPVVSRELGVRLGRIILVAVVEYIFAPCVPWVLCNRTDPQCINTQIGKISLFDFLCDTGKVAALVVHNIQDFG